MPLRRIPPPNVQKSNSTTPPQMDEILKHINPNLMETLVRRGLEQYKPPKDLVKKMEPIIEEKVMSLLHEKVIPDVGNQGKVYEWIERAQKPFDSKEEEEAFWKQLQQETGSDEFVFMLRFGCMDQRDGKGATKEMLIRNLFSSFSNPSSYSSINNSSLSGSESKKLLK